MAKSQDLENFEHVVERIIFEEDELKKLKIAIKHFTEGKISAKELKGLLLQCRGRMVQEITAFAFFIVDTQTEEQTPAKSNNDRLLSPDGVEAQLRKEIEEKNELLEIVAKRVNRLVSKRINEDSCLVEDQKIEDQIPISIEQAKEEVERCLTQIGAEQWIEMCYYDDYQFFVKLNVKLEELYEGRFGKSKRGSNNATAEKEIMAIKVVKLGFPKDIETILKKYVKIRNKFSHSMVDISSSNLELAQEAYVKVFVDVIVNNLDPKLLLNNRENLYSCLKDFFSQRLTGNRVFRKKIVERLETVFYN